MCAGSKRAIAQNLLVGKHVTCTSEDEGTVKLAVACLTLLHPLKLQGRSTDMLYIILLDLSPTCSIPRLLQCEAHFTVDQSGTAHCLWHMQLLLELAVTLAG